MSHVRCVARRSTGRSGAHRRPAAWRCKRVSSSRTSLSRTTSCTGVLPLPSTATSSLPILRHAGCRPHLALCNRRRPILCTGPHLPRPTRRRRLERQAARCAGQSPLWNAGQVRSPSTWRVCQLSRGRRKLGISTRPLQDSSRSSAVLLMHRGLRAYLFLVPEVGRAAVTGGCGSNCWIASPCVTWTMLHT